jgi:shikimate dehydrogenase
MKILGANPIIVSRDNSIGITYDELKDIKHYSLIINTTPVGMYPNCDKEILDKDTVIKSDLCVDIICNPKVTKFLEYAKEGYNGILMLVFQAIRAEILWQEKEIKYDLKELLELL